MLVTICQEQTMKGELRNSRENMELTTRGHFTMQLDHRPAAMKTTVPSKSGDSKPSVDKTAMG